MVSADCFCSITIGSSTSLDSVIGRGWGFVSVVCVVVAVISLEATDPTGGVSGGGASILSAWMLATAGAVGTVIGGDVGGVASVIDGVWGITCADFPSSEDGVWPEGVCVSSASLGVSMPFDDWSVRIGSAVELGSPGASLVPAGGDFLDIGSGTFDSGSFGSDAGFVSGTSAEMEK